MADGMGLNNGKRIAPLVSAPTEMQGDNIILKAIQDVASNIFPSNTPNTLPVSNQTLFGGIWKSQPTTSAMGIASLPQTGYVSPKTDNIGPGLIPSEQPASSNVIEDAFQKAQAIFPQNLERARAAGGVPQNPTAQVPDSVELPKSPNVAQPVTGGIVTKPSANKWWTQDNWRISGMGGVTPQGEMPTAVRITENGDVGRNDLLEARGIPMPAGERLVKETFDAVDAMKKRNSIKATKVIADLLRNEYTARTAGKAGGIENAKLVFEMQKYANDNNMKNPIKFMEAINKIAPPVLNEWGMPTGEKDITRALTLWQDMGLPIPAGAKINQQPKITEAVATENLKRQNITGEKAKKYIEEGKAKGYIK